MFAGIDLTVVLIACGCCVGLLGIGSVLSFGFGIIGFLIDIITTILNLVFGLISSLLGGGPEGCCGCLTLLFVLLSCGGIVFFVAQSLSTCGTPEAVNFCRIFG